MKMARKNIFSISLLLLSFIPHFALSRTIIVDKLNLQLYVIERSDTLLSVPISVGANYGDKLIKGDKRTPEGSFYISQIQNSSKWKHDFGDGNGEINGAYGPWFLRLKTSKWTSIGIHGTCFPESIGTRASEGCVRLLNQDIIRLKELTSLGTTVIILPDSIDEI